MIKKTTKMSLLIIQAFILNKENKMIAEFFSIYEI